MGSTPFCYSISPSLSKLDFTSTHVFSPVAKQLYLDLPSFAGKSCLRKRQALVGVKAATLLVEKRERTTKKKKKPRVLVAGGGIVGLVFALAAKKKWFDVLMFEKDLNAIRGEGLCRAILIRSKESVTGEKCWFADEGGRPPRRIGIDVAVKRCEIKVIW